jgi:hypothetical protein
MKKHCGACVRSERSTPRECNEAHTHAPQRILDYDTEYSRNCEKDGKQSST